MDQTSEPHGDPSVEPDPRLQGVVADLSWAPLPTPAQLRRRRSPVVQTARFVAFNARIMRMVLKGHH